MRRTMCALLGAACAAAALSAPVHAAVQVSQSGWQWGNPTPQGNTIRAMDFVSGRGYAIGDDGTALRTDDGGQRWERVSAGVSTPLYGLAVIGKRAWAVGARGIITASRDGGASSRRRNADQLRPTLRIRRRAGGA